MKFASLLIPAMLAASASAADVPSEQIVSLVTRAEGAQVAFSVVVTDHTGARLATTEPLVVDLVVGDAVVGTITVAAGSAVSPAVALDADLAGSDQFRGRIRVAGTDAYAGDLRPTPVTPAIAN